MESLFASLMYMGPCAFRVIVSPLARLDMVFWRCRSGFPIEIYGHRARMRTRMKILGWCGSGREDSLDRVGTDRLGRVERTKRLVLGL
jgi:hypothetical protein